MSEDSNSQSDEYKRTNEIEYVADLPGARVEENRLYIVVDGGEMDVTDRSERELGETDVTDRSEREVGKVVVKSGEVDVVDREDRELGAVSVASLPDAVTEEGGLSIAEPITVEQGAVVPIESEALSQLASTVTEQGRVEVEHPTLIDISSRGDRNLGRVSVTEQPDSDRSAWKEQMIENGEAVSTELSGPGADHLRGRIEASGPITVEIEWQSEGETVLTDTIGEESQTVELDEQLNYPELSVIVQNPDGQNSESQTINGLIHLT
jgi:hypothetical protein